MTCLTDYIGLVGCDDSEPESGLYINDLPGVTLESISKIGNAEQETYLGTWNEVQKRAVKKFATRISAKLMERYKIRSITESVNLLKYIDTVNNQTGTGLDWRGFTIELAPKSTGHFVASAFQSIFIKELSLYTKAVSGSPIALKVFDLDSGEVLGTYSVATPAVGWNTVAVNTSFNHYRLFVGYDATLVTSVEQEINQHSHNHFCDCCCSMYGDCDATIRGAVTDGLLTTVTDDELTFGQNTYGLTGIFTIGCSYENLVCNNRQVFATSLWYLMGVELMLERLYSDRLNRYTTVDLKSAAELKDYFQAEFDKEMEIAVGGISLDHADCCIECNAPLMVVESTP